MNDYTHDIERYLKGEMTASERNAFEKKALADPFLAEALEGAEQLSAAEFSDDVNALTEKIKQSRLAEIAAAFPAPPARKAQPKEVKIQATGIAWRWIGRIAAGLAILLVSAYFIWEFTQAVDHDTTLALEETKGPVSSSPLSDSAITTEPAIDESVEDTDSGESTILDRARKATSETLEARDEAKPDQQQAAGVPTQPSLVQEQPHAEAAETPIKLETKPVEISREDEKDKAADYAEKKEAVQIAGQKQALSRASVKKLNTIIRGKVTAEDGSGIPGVNVLIKGSTIGTVSDANGNYQIESTEEDPTLVFNFIGYSSTEVKTDDRNEANVQMNMDVAQLSEVVVVGYGPPSAGYIAPTVNLAHPETGSRAFRQYLESSIIYPDAAQENKVEGRVTVEFFIETDGRLTGFTVVRGIGSGCDEELIRLIREGPRWIPTMRDSVPVRDKARVRLKFNLPKQ
jgi:TonB family protein